MNKDNLMAFEASEASEAFRNAPTELVCKGARQSIAQAVVAELAQLLTQHQSLKDGQTRQGVVRDRYLPERTIVTKVGEVEIQIPKVRDRTGSRIKVNSRHFCRISKVPRV